MCAHAFHIRRQGTPDTPDKTDTEEASLPQIVPHPKLDPKLDFQTAVLDSVEIDLGDF